MDNIFDIELARIQPSPFNPRKHLGDLNDLANSIAEVGLQQPVVVRRVPGASTIDAITHELVFGHRRHAAAQLAGLQTITCIERDYDDDQVLEIQIVENSQREDVHPLDEADGFRVLHDRGREISEIAERIGRPPAFVAKRLQLLDLTPNAREAFSDEQLTVGAALALARLPADLQEAALTELLEAARESSFALWSGEGEAPPNPVSARAANHLIRGSYLLRLADAPWDLADEKAAKGKPSCSSCPARTGNQAHLWDDQAPDLCLDRACYRAKLDASFKRLEKSKEIRTLTEEEAQGSLVNHYGRAGAWVRLDHKEYVRASDDGGYEATAVAKVIEGHEVERAWAQDPESGAHVELAARAQIEAIVNELNGRATHGSVGGVDDGGWKEQQKREREKQKKRAAEARLALAAMVDQVEEAWEDHGALIMKAVITNVWSDTQKQVLSRRGITPEGFNHEKPLFELLEQLLADDRLGSYASAMALTFELAIGRHMPAVYTDGGDLWKQAVKELGIDMKAIRKAAAEELKPKRKPRAKKAAAQEA